KNMQVENVVVEYRDRQAGSESKLNTYSDGFKVLRTIVRLYKNYHPFGFFGAIGVFLFLLAFGFAVPVFVDFARTGLVERFPTLIVCGFVALAGIITFLGGIILSSLRQKEKQEFERDLIRIRSLAEE
ncbi:MAG: glycosyl transferase, partial [Lachnospiraceae bacterium]|nr:glycosyl transferase [Lachnospiraceae bacterium]